MDFISISNGYRFWGQISTKNPAPPFSFAGGLKWVNLKDVKKGKGWKVKYSQQTLIRKTGNKQGGLGTYFRIKPPCPAGRHET